METHEIENNGVALAPRTNQIARRDFGGTSLAVGNAATDALAAKARADVEARWIMAMRMPRNLDDVRQNIIAECKHPEFAKAAVYARPVGGGQVAEGLSIRFAEAAARLMGNISIETMTIYDSDDTRIVRVTVTDFETNATWSKDLNIRKTVERKKLKTGQRPLGERLNSYGERAFIVEATDDDVAIKEAALVSKASRTGIMRLVPGNIQREAMALCKRVMQDGAAKDPDGERKQILDAFAQLRILPSELEEFLGHPTTQIVPVEIERLRSIFTSIREGETTWREMMDTVLEARASATPANTAPKSQTAPTGEPAKPQTTPANEPPKAKRGAAGLKDKLAAETKPPETVDRRDKLQASIDEARARDAARIPPTIAEAAPDIKPAPSHVEEHLCPRCGLVPCEPPGICADCSNAARDAE